MFFVSKSQPICIFLSYFFDWNIMESNFPEDRILLKGQHRMRWRTPIQIAKFSMNFRHIARVISRIESGTLALRLLIVVLLLRLSKTAHDTLEVNWYLHFVKLHVQNRKNVGWTNRTSQTIHRRQKSEKRNHPGWGRINVAAHSGSLLLI